MQEGGVNAAWGRWLSQFEWDHYLTLTFSRDGTQQGARRAAEKYMGALTREVQGPVGYFWGTEYGAAGGRLHLHAMTENTRDLSYGELRELWPCGHAWVRPYLPAMGAEFYLTKYATKDLSADYEVSKSLRRLGKRRGAGQGRLFSGRDLDALRRRESEIILNRATPGRSQPSGALQETPAVLAAPLGGTLTTAYGGFR